MSRKQKIIIFIFTIIVSLIGGVIGGVLFRSYLLNSSFDVPLFGDINLGGSYQNGNLIISEPKRVIVEQNQRVEGVITQAKKSIVHFYKKKPAAESDIFSINNYYSPPDIVGQGLVLTNDGWIITADKIDAPDNYVAINYEQDIIEIAESYDDKISGYFFVKINANNLPAAQFAENNSAVDGQALITVGLSEVNVSYIKNSNYNYPRDLTVKSSEELYDFILISDDAIEKGDPVFGLDGAVAGLYLHQGLISPINSVKNLLSSLLENKEIKRPVLGVNYISLDKLVGEEEVGGALIARNAQGIAVIRKSPAAEAGLSAGDIIVEFDGIKVDKNNSLSKLTQGSKAEAEVELKILRRGEVEENIKVILGSE